MQTTIETMNNFYTVWVGGAEVTDFYVSFDTATAIKNKYESKDYEDVIIEKVADFLNQYEGA